MGYEQSSPMLKQRSQVRSVLPIDGGVVVGPATGALLAAPGSAVCCSRRSSIRTNDCIVSSNAPFQKGHEVPRVPKNAGCRLQQVSKQQLQNSGLAKITGIHFALRA